MKQERLGFLGLGAMGFAMCCGLHKAGYRMILPGWRRESMQKHGFNSIAPDGPAKAARFDEMVAEGAVSAHDQASLIAQSDVILLSLPTSAQVESVVLGEDGILAHAAPGSVVIDLTSGDAAVSRRLAAQLEARGVGFLDSPVSGGTHKAVYQMWSRLSADGNGQRDAMCLIREYERWCGRPIAGLAADAQPNK